MQQAVQQGVRWLASMGAILAAMAVAMAAYASHGAEGVARVNLLTAAAFAFGHGVALIALAPWARGRLAVAAAMLLLLGALVFCGALVAKSLFGLPSTLAPYGGMALIAGWLLQAVATCRR